MPILAIYLICSCRYDVDVEILSTETIRPEQSAGPDQEMFIYIYQLSAWQRLIQAFCDIEKPFYLL